MQKVKIKSEDGYIHHLHIYDVNKPKGYIQLIHGMEEHHDRYARLINLLNQNGYTVVASDLRGHGKNAPLLGFFKEKNGHYLIINDQKLITKYIMKTFHVKKVIIFSHSMGTIITRNLMQTESKKYSAVIMSGYPCPQSGTSAGILLASIIQKFKGAEYYSELLQKISVGVFNKKIKNPNTHLDWLSTNEDNVRDYIEDEYCGHGFKVSAFNDLYHIVANMTKVSRYVNVNRNLPILMLRGDSDPCTGYDKGSIKSISILKKAGFNNIKDIKYKDMRHEILNEKNNKKVYDDIISFLNK